jgi:hypothetical protein
MKMRAERRSEQDRFSLALRFAPPEKDDFRSSARTAARPVRTLHTLHLLTNRSCVLAAQVAQFLGFPSTLSIPPLFSQDLYTRRTSPSVWRQCIEAERGPARRPFRSSGSVFSSQPDSCLGGRVLERALYGRCPAERTVGDIRSFLLSGSLSPRPSLPLLSIEPTLRHATSSPPPLTGRLPLSLCGRLTSSSTPPKRQCPQPQHARSLPHHALQRELLMPRSLHLLRRS